MAARKRGAKAVESARQRAEDGASAPSVADARANRDISSFSYHVTRIVARIPRGRVCSYADVATLAGRPRAARGVGSALQSLPDDVDVPWWRVINARGTISPGGGMHRARLQRVLLEDEGVRFDDAGRVDWQRSGWQRALAAREVD